MIGNNPACLHNRQQYAFQDLRACFVQPGNSQVICNPYKKRQRRNNMSEETKDKTPIDLSHPSIGGRKVGHWVPSNQGKEIDFSSIPGVRCVMPPHSRVDAETKPAEPIESEEPEEIEDGTLREEDEAFWQRAEQGG
jgi:hypothetical protein